MAEVGEWIICGCAGCRSEDDSRFVGVVERYFDDDQKVVVNGFNAREPHVQQMTLITVQTKAYVPTDDELAMYVAYLVTEAANG